MTADEANQVAMELAEKDHAFVNATAEEWARKISEATGTTCSPSTVHKTALWKTTMQKTGRGRTKGGSFRTVTLTKKLEAVTRDDAQQQALDILIAEQEADSEPSSAEDDPPDRPQRVHFRR